MTKPRLDLPAILPEIRDIQSEDLRSRVEAVWQDLWQQSDWDRIEDVPTSKDIPYSNLTHTRAIVRMALAVAGVFSQQHGVKLNLDLLIAGALLQDVSKLIELRPTSDGTTEKSDSGRLCPHPFLGAHAAANAGLPDDVIHIILAHSPSSASFPLSLEGKVLYYVDQLDVLAIHKDRWKKTIAITK